MFLPFGQALSQTTTDSFQFTGLPQDTENASYHAGYRNFSTQQGRWLSPDPTNGSYDITNPQSFNRYAYVLNNPMAFIDPLGLDCIYNNGGVLEIVRDDCLSDTDDGYYVDGTIDINSFTYDRGYISYNYTPESGNSGRVPHSSRLVA